MKVLYLIRDYSMNGVVSHEPGVKASVSAKAEEIGVIARQRLSATRDSGNSFVSVSHSERGKYGKIDSFVWLEDPDTPDSPGSPLSIEFGRIHNFTGKYIPGNYIITGAAGLA
jgi:hypothetical protein